MTFIGLYMYDRAKDDVARGERKVQRIEFKEKNLLPLRTSDLKFPAPSTLGPSVVKSPLSATSATEKVFEEPPRRRSSSFSDQPRPSLSSTQSGWNLGSIREMTTPPSSPRNIPYSLNINTKFTRPDNRPRVLRGHQRRYSGSTHLLGPSIIVANGLQEGGLSPGIEHHPDEFREKVG